MAKRTSKKKMGRPAVYTTPGRPRLIRLSDELWNAIEARKGDNTYTDFIEAQLRETLGLAPLPKK